MALVLEKLKLEFRGLSDEEDEEDAGLGDDAGDVGDEEESEEGAAEGKEKDPDSLDENEG